MAGQGTRGLGMVNGTMTVAEMVGSARRMSEAPPTTARRPAREPVHRQPSDRQQLRRPTQRQSSPWQWSPWQSILGDPTRRRSR
jgi:hypothetical protein